MSGLPGSSPGPNGPGEGHLSEQTSPGRLGSLALKEDSIYERKTRTTKPMPTSEVLDHSLALNGSTTHLRLMKMNEKKKIPIFFI